MFDRKSHWENIYQTRELVEVSWYQSVPQTSLDLIEASKRSLGASIIDVGGGDSLLVDHLLDRGYKDVTVLDISDAAIQRAKARLAKRADQVKWIVADAAKFFPADSYDIWHDRAAFHFLTDDMDIARYIESAHDGLNPNGTLIIGTFSEDGPTKCSGINIQQYSVESLSHRFAPLFKKKRCLKVDHHTPSGKIQNFVFCSFSPRRQD